MQQHENASTGNNVPNKNIHHRQRGIKNTICLTKASPFVTDPTYLIGRSSFLLETPAAEGGQRMLLTYKLCTRASSEECSNIGVPEKSTLYNGHFIFLSLSSISVFLSLSFSLSLTPAPSFSTV